MKLISPPNINKRKERGINNDQHNYPIISWFSKDTEGVVELFSCSKEDTDVHTREFNLSKEESKGLKDSLSEKLTAANYKIF